MTPDPAAVPDGWQVVCLGDVSSIRREQVRPADGDSRPYVALEHIDAAGSLNGYGTAGDSISNKTVFSRGDTLYGKLRPNLRKVIRAEVDGVCSTDILAVFAREGLDGPFLSQLLRSDLLHQHAMRGVAGTKMPRTSWNHLRAFTLPLPPLAEQRAIAAVLDAIDEAIERTEEVIAATGRLGDALLHELLTRGPPGRHLEWADVPGLGTVPACWDVVRLGDVATVRNGTTPSRSRGEYWEGDVPFIKTSRVNDVSIDEPDEFITSRAVESAGAVVVPAGSVLIAMIGQGTTRGKTGRLRFDAAINQNFAAIYDITDELSLEFVFLWARHNYLAIRNRGQGTNQDALNCDLIEGLRLSRPSVAEQVEIADSVSALTEREAVEGRVLRELRHAKAATADALLTGRVRVRVSQHVT